MRELDLVLDDPRPGSDALAFRRPEQTQPGQSPAVFRREVDVIRLGLR